MAVCWELLPFCDEKRLFAFVAIKMCAKFWCSCRENCSAPQHYYFSHEGNFLILNSGSRPRNPANDTLFLLSALINTRRDTRPAQEDLVVVVDKDPFRSLTATFPFVHNNNKLQPCRNACPWRRSARSSLAFTMKPNSSTRKRKSWPWQPRPGSMPERTYMHPQYIRLVLLQIMHGTSLACYLVFC